MEVRKGFKQTEVGVIPEDWVVSTITQAAEMTTVGFVGSMSHLFTPNGIPVLRGQDILPNKLDATDTKFISQETHKLWKKSALRSGDVVMVRVGVGAGISCVIPSDLGEANAASLVVIRPSVKRLYAKFLSMVINSEFGKRQVESLLVGGAQPVINTATVAAFKFPLPPNLAEQEAIAEALSDADALIESLETLLVKKRQVKQGAMSELLSGERRLHGFSGKWLEKKLGDLVILSKAGVNPASSPETLFAHFSLPAFDAGAMPIMENGDQIGSNKFLVPENAVMISKLNPRIPRIWAPAHIPDNAVCSTEFLVLIPRENVNRNFLTVLCWSPTVSYQMELHAIGTTGSHQRINPSQALAIEVKLPPTKAEQTAIAEILSDMDAEIRAVEEKLSKARAVKAGMMSALLGGRVRLV